MSFKIARYLLKGTPFSVTIFISNSSHDEAVEFIKKHFHILTVSIKVASIFTSSKVHSTRSWKCWKLDIYENVTHFLVCSAHVPTALYHWILYAIFWTTRRFGYCSLLFKIIFIDHLDNIFNQAIFPVINFTEVVKYYVLQGSTRCLLNL